MEGVLRFSDAGGAENPLRHGARKSAAPPPPTLEDLDDPHHLFGPKQAWTSCRAPARRRRGNRTDGGGGEHDRGGSGRADVAASGADRGSDHQIRPAAVQAPVASLAGADRDPGRAVGVLDDENNAGAPRRVAAPGDRWRGPVAILGKAARDRIAVVEVRAADDEDSGVAMASSAQIVSSRPARTLFSAWPRADGVFSSMSFLRRASWLNGSVRARFPAGRLRASAPPWPPPSVSPKLCGPP